MTESRIFIETIGGILLLVAIQASNLKLFSGEIVKI